MNFVKVMTFLISYEILRIYIPVDEENVNPIFSILKSLN